jgi:tetratricopeptide (TPR) repeat protein
MTNRTWQAARIDEITRTGNFWIPVRKHFDIAAFGVNAWVAKEDGDKIVSEHAEDTGHEELYFVASGHATFTVGGEEVDAPAGTFVFVRDPETRRGAVATEKGTTILTVGAKPGEAFEVSNWEANAEMWPLYEAGDYEGAAALLADALERGHDTGLLYNLACMEALAGRSEDAIGHLSQALEGASDSFRKAARDDSDLDSIKGDPRVASLLGTS